MLLDCLAPAPPPGYAPFEPWKPAGQPPAGPIGLLLKQLRDNCMGVGRDWIIRDANQMQLNIFACPAQDIKPKMHLACTHMRTLYCSGARSDLADLRRFSPGVVHKVNRAMPKELHSRLFSIHAWADFLKKSSRCLTLWLTQPAPIAGIPWAVLFTSFGSALPF